MVHCSEKLLSSKLKSSFSNVKEYLAARQHHQDCISSCSFSNKQPAMMTRCSTKNNLNINNTNQSCLTRTEDLATKNSPKMTRSSTKNSLSVNANNCQPSIDTLRCSPKKVNSTHVHMTSVSRANSHLDEKCRNHSNAGFKCSLSPVKVKAQSKHSAIHVNVNHSPSHNCERVSSNSKHAISITSNAPTSSKLLNRNVSQTSVNKVLTTNSLTSPTIASKNKHVAMSCKQSQVLKFKLIYLEKLCSSFTHLKSTF